MLVEAFTIMSGYHRILNNVALDSFSYSKTKKLKKIQKY